MSRLARIETAATLEELYELIPQPLHCDGSCHHSCGPIGFSQVEGDRMLTAGALVPNAARGEHLDGAACPALDPASKLCTVYDQRPALCRIWGVTTPDVRMRCSAPRCYTPHPLTDEECRAVLWRSMELGGRP